MLDLKDHHILIHVPADFPYTADLFPANRTFSYAQAPSLEEAHIALRSEGDEIVIEPCKSTLVKCQRETRFPLKGNPAHLQNTIDGIARFIYILDCHNETNPFNGQFALEMHRLRGEPTQRTLDQNVGHEGNMIMDSTVRFTSEAGAKYGFTIRNTSPKALFPFLFYFDPDEYTIQEWYSPGRWLKSGETATIGSGAEQAFEFALLPGQHDSSGFLRLLMASDYVYPHWEQKSPFDEAFKPAELMTVRELLDRFKAIEWDALTVMLTMTAH